jgi:hypothetical protein
MKIDVVVGIGNDFACRLLGAGVSCDIEARTIFADIIDPGV